MTSPTRSASRDRLNFEQWYGAFLEKLIPDTAAGFICATVAFPLLERYLRVTSNSEPKAEPFQKALLQFLPELKTAKNAGKFWWVYRHGLLHDAELRRKGDWLSHATPIITVQGDSFCLNPALFAQRVLDKIRQDFEIFARDGLPQVETVSVVTQLGLTTTYLGTGSRRP